ncbi:MAG: hypothetical protein EOO38_20910, partial [Cytophagaceae bacterium]
MVELQNRTLVFSFPEVHADAVCNVTFQRTLRIPDDNCDYPLPPGLGSFPLEHVEDHAAKVPATWLEQGGVVLPIYQSEAVWIGLSAKRGRRNYPFAVKIAAGKVDAVSG